MAYRSLGGVVRKAERNIPQDMDTVILVTGSERAGKSTLAMRLALMIDPNLKLEQIVWDGEDLISIGQTLPKGSVTIWDEAIKGGFNRDALSGTNKMIAKWFIVCGERNLTSILCWPNIHWLDPMLREHRVQVWAHVSGRGLATFFYPERRPIQAFFSRDTDNHAGTIWHRDFRYHYNKLSGPFWDSYIAAKSQFVRHLDSSSLVSGRMGREMRPVPQASEIAQRIKWLRPITERSDIPL